MLLVSFLSQNSFGTALSWNLESLPLPSAENIESAENAAHTYDLLEQNTPTGLLVSFIDDPLYYNMAFTEDQALAAMLYSAQGKAERAENILMFYRLKYFEDIAANGVFTGFSRAYDALTGENALPEVDLWSNALIGMAFLQHYGKTHDARDIDVLIDIANVIVAYYNYGFFTEYPRLVRVKEVIGAYLYLNEFVNIFKSTPAYVDVDGFGRTLNGIMSFLRNLVQNGHLPYGIVGPVVVDNSFDTETHMWVRLAGLEATLGVNASVQKYLLIDNYVRPDGTVARVSGVSFGREVENKAVSLPATVLYCYVNRVGYDNISGALCDNILPHSTKEFVPLSSGEYAPFGKRSLYATLLYILLSDNFLPFSTHNVSRIDDVRTPIDNVLRMNVGRKPHLVTAYAQLSSVKVYRAWLDEQIKRSEWSTSYISRELNSTIPLRIQEIEGVIERVNSYIEWVENLNARSLTVDSLVVALENDVQMLEALESRLCSLENSFLMLENIYYQYSVPNLQNMLKLLQSDAVFGLRWAYEKKSRLDSSLVFYEPFVEYPALVPIDNYGGWYSTNENMPYIDTYAQSLVFENVSTTAWHSVASIEPENVTLVAFVVPAVENSYSLCFQFGDIQLGGIESENGSLRFVPLENEGNVAAGASNNCKNACVYKITVKLGGGKYAVEFTDYFRGKVVYRIENVPCDNYAIENIGISFSGVTTPSLVFVKRILLFAGPEAGESILERVGNEGAVAEWVDGYRQSLLHAYADNDLTLASSVVENQPPRGELAWALRQAGETVIRVLTGNAENENWERMLADNWLENGCGFSADYFSVLQLRLLYSALTSGGWGGYIYRENDDFSLPVISIVNSELWKSALTSNGWGQVYSTENKLIYVPSIKVQQGVLSALTDYHAGGYIVPPPENDPSRWGGAVVSEVEADGFVPSIQNTLRYIDALTDNGIGGYIYDRENRPVKIESMANIQRKINAILENGGWVRVENIPAGTVDNTGAQLSTAAPSSIGFITMKDNRFFNPADNAYWTPVIVAYQTWLPDIYIIKSFSEIDADFRMMKEMGVDAVRLDFPWKDIEVENGTFDFGKYDYILDLAEKHGLRVFVQIGYIYPPSWAPESWYTNRLPYLAWEETGEFISLRTTVMSYANGEAREGLKRFIQAIVDRYRDRGNIVAWIIGTEDTFVIPWYGAQLGYDSISENSFREWLSAQYGDNVDRLNLSWEENYASFDEAEMPDIMTENPNVVFDLVQWRENVLADFISSKARWVREIDNAHLITYALVGLPYMESSLGYTGEDPRKITGACADVGAPLDFITANNYIWPFSGHERKSGIIGLEIASWQSGLPVLVEGGISTSWNWRTTITEEDQAKLLYDFVTESIFGGAIGVQLFTWEDRPQIIAPVSECGFGIVHENRAPKPAYYALEKICKDKIRWQLAPKAYSENGAVAIYWPETSDCDYYRFYAEAMQLAGSLRRIGVKYSFIDNIASGLGFSAVALPNNSLLYDGDMAFIRDNLIPSGVSVFAFTSLPGETVLRAEQNSAFDDDLSSIFGLSRFKTYTYRSGRGRAKQLIIVEKFVISAFSGGAWYLEVKRENIAIHIRENVAPLVAEENYTFFTWSFCTGLVDNGITIWVADDNDNSVMFSVKDHGASKAVFIAWGLDFVTENPSEADYVTRAKWISAVFENILSLERVSYAVEASETPLGAWSFDEGSGNIAYDSSVNGNNGTIGENVAWCPGKSGNALMFPGTAGGYVSVPHSTTLAPDNGLPTLHASAWVFIDSEIPVADENKPWESGYMVLAKYSWAGEWMSDGWFMKVERGESGDGMFMLTVALHDPTNYWGISVDKAGRENQWVHIAFAYTGWNNRLRLYVDGVDRTSEGQVWAVGAGGNVKSSTENLYIGGTSGGYMFKGKIDDVRISTFEYTRSLVMQVSYLPEGENATIALVRNFGATPRLLLIGTQLVENRLLDDVVNGASESKISDNTFGIIVFSNETKTLLISENGWTPFTPLPSPEAETVIGTLTLNSFETLVFKAHGDEAYMWCGPPLSITESSWYRIYAPPEVNPIPRDAMLVNSDSMYDYYVRMISGYLYEYYRVEKGAPIYWRWYDSVTDSAVYRDALSGFGWLRISSPVSPSSSVDLSGMVFMGYRFNTSYYKAGSTQTPWLYGGEIFAKSPYGVYKFIHGISGMELYRSALTSANGMWLPEPLRVLGSPAVRHKSSGGSFMRFQQSLSSMNTYLRGMKENGCWVVAAETPMVLLPTSVEVVHISDEMIGAVKFRGREYDGVFIPSVTTVDAMERILMGEDTPFGGFVPGAGGEAVWYPHPQDTVKIVAKIYHVDFEGQPVYDRNTLVPIWMENRYVFVRPGDTERIRVDNRALLIEREVNDIIECRYYENADFLEFGVSSRVVTKTKDGKVIKVADTENVVGGNVLCSVVAHIPETGDVLYTGTELYDNIGELVRENTSLGYTEYRRTNTIVAEAVCYENGTMKESKRLSGVLYEDDVSRLIEERIPPEHAQFAVGMVFDPVYLVYDVSAKYFRGEHIVAPHNTYPTVEVYENLKIKVNTLSVMNGSDFPTLTLTYDVVSGDVWIRTMEGWHGVRRSDVTKISFPDPKGYLVTMQLDNSIVNLLPEVVWVFVERNVSTGNSFVYCYDGGHPNPVLTWANGTFTVFRYDSMMDRVPANVYFGQSNRVLAFADRISLERINEIPLEEKARDVLSQMPFLNNDTRLLSLTFRWQQLGNDTTFRYIWNDPLGRVLVFENPASETVSVNVYKPNSEYVDVCYDIRNGAVVRKRFFSGFVPGNVLPLAGFENQKVPVFRVERYVPAGDVRDNRMNPEPIVENEYIMPDDPLSRTIASYNSVFDIWTLLKYSENTVTFPSDVEIVLSGGVRIRKEFTGTVESLPWYSDGRVVERTVSELSDNTCSYAIRYRTTGDIYGEVDETVLPGGDILSRTYITSLFFALKDIPHGTRTATVAYARGIVPVPMYMFDENRLICVWESVVYDEKRLGQITYTYSYLNPLTGYWERWRSVYYGIERLRHERVSFESEFPLWATVAVICVVLFALALFVYDRVRRHRIKKALTRGLL